MNELKTLKDIDDYVEVGCFKHELRQEAIKWIKEFEIGHPHYIGKFDPDDDDSTCHEAMKEIFKHFFNIEESELA